MPLAQLRQLLLASKQRGLLHLQGTKAWSYAWLNKALSELSNIDALWFGEMTGQSSSYSVKQQLEVRLKLYKKYLGQERDLVVFDCYSGFNPDAFGAIAGIVKLGGLCILITPNDEYWANYLDPELTRLCTEPYKVSDINQHYSQRLVRILSHSSNVIKISEHKQSFPVLPPREAQDLTGEQTRVIQQLQSLLINDQAPSFLAVIQADRGRGKSALLGLLSANLMMQNSKCKFSRILVTAPLSGSIETLFLHCLNELQRSGVSVTRKNNELSFSGGSIQFIAPDKLMIEQPDADLLLVDEAAAIPIQMLKPLIDKYKKAIFATTVHGYEGTGRGFEYKLKPLLKQQYHSLAELTLSQPIRWYEDDMLEHTVNSMLALNVEISEPPMLNFEDIQFKVWSPLNLLEQEAKLTEIFALLVSAHYRTSPSDLRQILDGPNIHIVTLEQNDQTLAAAVIAEEGALPNSLSELIWQGRRRPRGHLFPQSLLAHSGFKQAGQYRYNRIIRIATHPDLQSKGLGSKLLADIESWSMQQDIDFLCTSYGYDARLLQFWQSAGLKTARLGLKQEASTGEFSVLMFKSLNKQSSLFFEQVITRFIQTWSIELKFCLRASEFALSREDIDYRLQAQDEIDLIAFSEHFRTLNTCLLAMCRFVYTTKNQFTIPSLILDKCHYYLSDEHLIDKYKLTGEKELINKLRSMWKQVLEQHAAIKVDT